MLRQHQEGRQEFAGPYFPDENFPLAPEAIRVAYQHYWHDTQPSFQAATEQQLAVKTVNTLISDFYSEYLTPQTYGGAMLAPLIEALETETHEAALAGLHTYIDTTDESIEDVLFALGIAGDQTIIRQFQNTLIENLYQDNEWTSEPNGADPRDILSIRTELGVNIESHLIAAANSLRWFLSHNPSGQADALQRARRAESLHAPLSEIIGFDGIAMALQSHIALMRLRQSDQTDYIAAARTQRGYVSEPGAADERVDRILRGTLGKSTHHQVLTHGERHGVMIGEGVSGREDIRTIWRIKTVGSAARKLSQLPQGSELTDIFGATLITNDARQSGVMLNRALLSALSDPRMTLRPSPQRDKPLHVRGTPEFIADVADGMGMASVAALARVADLRPTTPNDYHVAKLSMDYQEWGNIRPTSVEIQINTKEGREDARIGSPSHALHKLTHRPATEEQVMALAQIRQGKALLGQNGLTLQSRQRAEQLYRHIKSAA